MRMALEIPIRVPGNAMRCRTTPLAWSGNSRCCSSTGAAPGDAARVSPVLAPSSGFAWGAHFHLLHHQAASVGQSMQQATREKGSESNGG
ncbi:MAG: hypothetical protein R3C12_02425 [Planctomycetaceae bacterium]